MVVMYNNPQNENGDGRARFVQATNPQTDGPQIYGMAPAQIPQNLPVQPQMPAAPPPQQQIGSPQTPSSPPPTPFTGGGGGGVDPNFAPQQNGMVLMPNGQLMPAVPMLPPPRNNPKTYILMQSNCYRVLTLDQANKIEIARCQGAPQVDIGYNKIIDTNFQAHPSLPGVGKNQAGDVQEYVPSWFFLDNSLRWSPMSPTMCFKLTAAKNAGKPLESDSERDYDLVGFNQKNRESKRVRPLLHLREDGSAIRGECMAMWAYQGMFRGASATMTVPFEVCEKLDRAVMQGHPTATVQFTPQGSPGAINVNVVVNHGCTEHEGTVVGNEYQKYKMIRFFPTWFFLDDEMHWASLDFMATVQLDAACAYGYLTSNDSEREYDLIRLLQINVQSKKVRPLMQIRARAGFVPAPMIAVDQFGAPLQQQPVSPAALKHPDVFNRANIVLKKSFSGDVASQVSNLSNPPELRILYFLNALVQEYNFVVKGGVLRDAIVRNDVKDMKDIDIELPGEFTREGMMAWVDKFLAGLQARYGITRDPSAEIKRRATADIFADGGARSKTEDGMLTIPVILPGGLKVDLECVTPWNNAYSPPRNIDVSVNNLRITRDCPEMTLNVAMPFGPDSSNRFSVSQIIDQILAKEATPSYDFKWVDGTPGKTGEGFSGQKWCVGFNEQYPYRAMVMDGRFEKMRAKGFKFVEGPRSA